MSYAAKRKQQIFCKMSSHDSTSELKNYEWIKTKAPRGIDRGEELYYIKASVYYFWELWTQLTNAPTVSRKLSKVS